MSEETTKRIIEVEVDQTRAISSIVEYRNKLSEVVEEEKKWKEQLDKGAISQEDFDKKMAASNEVKKEYRRIIGETSREIQNSLKQDKAKSDSLKSMRAELSNATKDFDAMSKAERESAKGTELLDHIRDLTNQITDVEEATGRYQRNVGHYQLAMEGITGVMGKAKTAFEGAGVATGGLDKGMKLLSSNPWMALVGIIVGLLVKLRDRLKENQQMTDSLGNAMDSVKPIFEIFGKWIGKIADVLTNVLNWAIEKAIDGIAGLGRVLQKVGSWFGKDWGGSLIEASDKMKEMNEKTQETTVEIDEQTEAVKSNTKAINENAKAKEDASKAEAEAAKAAEEYRKQTLSEMQKAEDALNGIIQDAFEKRRAIENTAYQRSHDALLAKMVAEEEANGTQTELYKAYMDQWEALEIQHQQNLTQIQKDAEDAREKIRKEEDDKQKKDIQEQIKLEYSKYEAVANVTGAISDLMEAASDDNEELAKASKIVALAEVAIQQGLAIAKAVNAAADIPFPGNIPAIASSVAAAISAIIPAIKSINSVKLARGTDYVNGPGTSTSDSIPAMLSKGEGVVNARANAMYPGVVAAMNAAGNAGVFSPALEMLRKSNGAPVQLPPSSAIDRANMAAAFRAAIEDLNISVSVDEIAEKQNRVKSLEILSSI